MMAPLTSPYRNSAAAIERTPNLTFLKRCFRQLFQTQTILNDYLRQLSQSYLRLLSQTVILHIFNYCQNPNLTSIQLKLTLTAVGFDVIMTVHYHQHRQEIYLSSVESGGQCKLTEYQTIILQFHRQLYQTIFDYLRPLSYTIIVYLGPLSQTIFSKSQILLGKYHRLSKATILDYPRQLSQTILCNYLRLSQTILGN